MTDNPLLHPLFVRHQVPELLANMMWVNDELSHRSAVGGLASLALHQDVCNFLVAKSIPRAMFLAVADRLPADVRVPRTLATLRQDLRLLQNMAVRLGRDLLQNCRPEAQLALNKVLSEGNRELMETFTTIQAYTGSISAD
jgi:hypothetical protein